MRIRELIKLYRHRQERSRSGHGSKKRPEISAHPGYSYFKVKQTGSYRRMDGFKRSETESGQGCNY